MNSPTPSVQWLAWARAVGCSCGRTALLLEQPGLSIVWLPTHLGCRSCSLRSLYNPLRFLCSQPSHLQIAFLKTQILLILPYSLSLAVTQFDKYSSSSQPLHPRGHRLTPSWPPFLPDELTRSLWVILPLIHQYISVKTIFKIVNQIMTISCLRLLDDDPELFKI